jgi:1,2-diacylglycerol 3-alpha-glucosyltransferase/glucuronosyltransferase
LRILIATDQWLPVRHGIERLLHRLVETLQSQGDEVEVIGPDRFETTVNRLLPELEIAIRPGRSIAPMIESFAPDAVHIATEGPVGFAARSWCRLKGKPYTTSYLTQMPAYLEARHGIPPAPVYARLRAFHEGSARLMVPTASVAAELESRGFRKPCIWPFGVDTDLFRPRPDARLDLPRPILISVARLAPEKNIEAFLALDLPGTRILVGDGPLRESLHQRFPGAHLVGFKEGEELARLYAGADVFVFPSRTDTFGLAILEALASGLPVAAFPVPGPIDILGGSDAGVLGEDLAKAVKAALAIPRERARAHAMAFSWAKSAERFRSLLETQP